ncbi:hypothetical protein IV102_37930 [bacterium]|nr:hypothetical protein [bacterium]
MAKGWPLLALLLFCGCAKPAWVAYSSSIAGLEAHFPVAPVDETRSFPVGDLACVVHTLVARKDLCEYSVSYFEYPRGIRYDEHHSIEVLARRLKGKVVQEFASSLATSHSMQPARAFRLVLDDGRLVEGLVAAAWENTLHPHRIYQAMVVRPAQVPVKDTQDFLAGLKFLDE